MCNICYLITDIEVSTIIKKISKKTIKKQTIEVEIITPSTSVLISNMAEKKRNKEFLKLYFNNVNFSGVSEYESLEILDDGRVIVHLLDQDSKLTVSFKIFLFWVLISSLTAIHSSREVTN